MSKALCPAGCGKKFISAVTAHAHADQVHPDWDNPKNIKRKGWATPYGFGDWTHPITYDEACAQMKAMADSVKHLWPKTNEIEGDEPGVDNANEYMEKQ